MLTYTRKLYLIPSTLGDSEITNVIPALNIQIIKSLSEFVVEEEKTARRFLIKSGYYKNLDEIKFYILNEHTKPDEVPNIFAESEPNDIGLLSEAGIPSVADPGALLVREAHKKNIKVIPLTGPSSILLALMASGMNGQNFSFNGYLPVKSHERDDKIRFYEKRSALDHQSQIFIEAPYRNNQLIAAFFNNLKPNTQLCIACNLTLPNEWIKTKSINEWKRSSPPDLKRQPTVFLLQA